MTARSVRRTSAAGAALVLGGAAIGLTAHGDHLPPAASLSARGGTPAVTVSDAQLSAAIDAVDVGEVPRQFSRPEVAAHVLTELLDLAIDQRLARAWGVRPDDAAARRADAAGIARAGSESAFQQQLIRSPGLGWAGSLVYERDTALRGQLAKEQARRLTPVPAAELQAEYTAHLGAFANAHVQILTTPRRSVAAADAGVARRDPGSFPALARRDTDDDTHRAAGGDYGWALARGQLYAAVDDAIFAARPGSILGPIPVAQTPPEYYDVRVLSVTDLSVAQVAPQLSRLALAPEGSFVQAALAAARRARAGTVTLGPGYGRWDPTGLAVETGP